jgi:hypothetical protein
MQILIHTRRRINCSRMKYRVNSIRCWPHSNLQNSACSLSLSLAHLLLRKLLINFQFRTASVEISRSYTRKLERRALGFLLLLPKLPGALHVIISHLWLCLCVFINERERAAHSSVWLWLLTYFVIDSVPFLLVVFTWEVRISSWC